MEIGLVYSSKDPRQREARDFVRQFVQDRGILARIYESDQPVDSPTLIINGQALTDLRKQSRDKGHSIFPSIKEIARALDRYTWSL